MPYAILTSREAHNGSVPTFGGRGTTIQKLRGGVEQQRGQVGASGGEVVTSDVQSNFDRKQVGTDSINVMSSVAQAACDARGIRDDLQAYP